MPGCPRPFGHFVVLHKAPRDAVRVAEPQEVTNRRTDFQSRALGAGGFRLLMTEDILPVVGRGGAHGLPLGVADPVVVMNGDPPVPAYGNGRPLELAPEP